MKPRVALLRFAALALLAGMLAAGSARAAQRSPRGPVAALAIAPGSGSLLEAAGNGLYRSTDEGRTWSRLPASARGRITSIAVAAKGGIVYVAGPGAGVLRSDDGGRRWTAADKGLPGKDVLALATHATQPRTVYAYVAKRGIFRSEDAGGRWKLMDAGPRQPIRSLVHSDMAGSMQTGWFFAATDRGVSRSMDCFCGWRDAGALGKPVRALAYDPRAPEHLYAATDDGLYASANGGEKWQPARSPARAIAALAVSPSGALYAAMAGGALFRSTDGGRTWAPVDA